MQQGFAMLEVGSCAKDHTKEILLKNIMDIAIGAASWWIVGHAIANGDDGFRNSGVNGVFGTSGFGYINAATVGKPGFGGQAEWFFGLSFAATSATIVSGAIAERCNMIPYFLLACLLTSFVYPVVAHVAWHESGRLSAYRDERLAFGCGLLDFAGGGVVHLTGGVAALAAAWSVGPRDNKYTSRGDPVPMRQQSVVLQVLGTLTLWLGWFAFNGGSVLSASRAGIAAHACFTTTLSGAAACLSTGVFFYATKRRVDPAAACNGILAGLVAITPGCATSNALGAMFTGLVAGPLYGASAHFVEYKLRIDDVCSAVSVHATCGMTQCLIPCHRRDVFSGTASATGCITRRHVGPHRGRALRNPSVLRRSLRDESGPTVHGRVLRRQWQFARRGHRIHPAGRGLGRGPGPRPLRGHEADLRRAVGLRGPHFGF